MTTALSKIRIYDLAKELKMESKRLIEEVRREGVDVSVPSNTISKELAEKIRNKYFPKKEVHAPRSIRVVKKAARPVETETPAADDEHSPQHAPVTMEPAPESTPAPPTLEAHAPEVSEPPAAGGGGGARLVPARLVKRPAATRAERPEEAAVAEAPAEAQEVSYVEPEAAAVETEEFETPAPAAVYATEETEMETVPAAAVPSGPSATPAPARQVRALRPTTAALNAGIRHGERAPDVAPAVVTPPAAARARSGGGGRDERPRNGRGGRDEALRGTPGESATPQTTYIPPADARRPGGRPGSRRGTGRLSGGPRERGGRYEKDFVLPPKALTPEQRFAQNLALAGETKQVSLVEGSTVKEFAEKLGIKPKEVVTLLMQRGVFATINQPLDDEVAVDLGKRFGFEVSFMPYEDMVTGQELEDILGGENIDDYVEEARAPVVTVMGHVDHGKTSLLDAIRTAKVAEGEAGGITQHIGAYSVQVASADDPLQLRRVVFLDTPGHEAFTLMRARGAKATDVVVLVVAADDGVMPQTIEAVEHAKAAGVPIVVAINKIDKPDANPDRVKQGLAGLGLQPVDWGGETEMVAVSAKKRENLETLLETILLTADILNLKASPTRLASGVVLEAKLDRGRGAVATVLVQQGTLKVHDPFIVGQIFGKVRAMFNDRGELVTEVGPATPVEVLGMQGVPQAGDTFQVVADITKAQSISQHRQMISRQAALVQTTKRGIEALGQQETKELLIVVKADVQGSVEVLKSTLQKLSTEKVKVKVIRSGVGAITESDVLLASATQASASSSAVVIIGFNVRPEVRAAELGKHEHVDVRLHSIIYKVEEEIRAAMLGMLDAIETERIIGNASVQEVFRVPKIGAVAGCRVTSGVISRKARARLIRDGVVAWEGQIASLRRFKDDAAEVREGFECGIGLENFNDIKVNDQIEAYVIESVAATEL
ncbi:MAG TPA: translation initiation factor IF-2 [Pyrinomonadaceae bacterium]